MFSLFAGAVSAAQPLAIEKTKTGILPGGGFYGLYEVSCRDERTASIGALSRRSGPWCVARQGDLQCFSRPQEAAFTACNSLELANVDSDAAPVGPVQ
ncbi:MAG: hypothetical protein HKN19_04575 [Halioglobus sp.]|nr:hypothetical protein [Halioglobus sp.]